MKTENTRIFPPLPANHPLIGDSMYVCWICRREFAPFQRTCAYPMRTSDRVETVEAKPVHATCAYRGALVYAGNTCYVIDRIADGGNEFPVITTDGKKFRFDEVGLDGK